MTDVSATQVKELRDKTGFGIMECRKALTATGGDLTKAAELLAATGTVKAAKRADRIAAEGLVSVAVEGRVGAIAELNTETDFVARNEAFRGAALAASRAALAGGGVDRILESPFPGRNGTVADAIQELVAKTGERIQLRRSATVKVEHGIVASYVHNVAAPQVGQIGVLVAIESAAPVDALLSAGRQLAMHIAASAPAWVSRDAVPADVIAARRAELAEAAQETGKPAAVVEKMIEGRLNKYLQESALLEQAFIIDLDQTVGQFVAHAAHAAGAPITVREFVRFKVGEGIDRPAEP